MADVAKPWGIYEWASPEESDCCPQVTECLMHTHCYHEGTPSVTSEEECRSHKVYCTSPVDSSVTVVFCFHSTEAAHVLGRKISSKQSHKMCFFSMALPYCRQHWRLLPREDVMSCWQFTDSQAAACFLCMQVPGERLLPPFPPSAWDRRFPLAHAAYCTTGFFSCGIGCSLHWSALLSDDQMVFLWSYLFCVSLHVFIRMSFLFSVF